MSDKFMNKLGEILSVPASSLSDDYSLDEENFDSIIVLSVIALVDEEFDVTLPGDELTSVTTIGELMALIHRSRGAGTDVADEPQG